MHHFALLAGYGAEAIHPYLALETLAELVGGESHAPQAELAKRFIKAISKGLYKVMSKMGISTYQSYCGAQIFEAVGLQREFIAKYFTGTSSNVEGIGLFEIAEEAHRLHRAAFGHDPLLDHALDAGGEYYYRIRGEDHMWTPDSIAKLQHAARTGNAQTYKEYAALINDQTKRTLTLRGLFEFRFAPTPVSAVGGRAGRGDREALRHRRDEPGVDIHRGARHARHRDEPHRRQVEHRRRRRGRAALSAGEGRGDAEVADRLGRRATFRSRKATRCARGSSRWPRPASG